MIKWGSGEGERGGESYQMASSKTHIVVSTFPGQGHINPMLQFSKRLSSKGLKVTLVTTSSLSILGNNIQIQDSFVKIEQIYDGFDEGDKIESIVAYLQRFKAVASQSLAELIQKLNNSECPPKVLVYDSVMPWALEVAQEFGLRGVSFFTQSCAISAIYYHLEAGHIKIPLEESPVSLPPLPLLETNDMPSFFCNLTGGSDPSLLSLVVNQFSNFQKADWLLFNTFDKLEEEIVKWMASQWPVKSIGPTIPSIYLDKRLEDDRDYGLNLFKPSSEACMKWLDTKENASVVYMSFGSLARLSEAQMEELAQGMKNSNTHFLWVVRASEESKLPSTFMEEISGKGLIVNWCPQLDVLAHRAVGCFLTHCGWNSTIEAVSLGVPMVAMPYWSDQMTNAKCIVDVWNVGVRLKANEGGIICRNDIELSIKEVMEGERGHELRRNATKWKELAVEAVNEGGSSDKNIEDFISEFVCTSFGQKTFLCLRPISREK